MVLTVALTVPAWYGGSETAAAAPALNVAPTNPVHREFIHLSGRFGTRVARPVRVQYYNGNRWVGLTQGRTDNQGRFRLRTRAVAPSRLFRVVAPRATINGRTYKAARTANRRVRTVKPTAALRLVPAPVGQAKNTTTSNLTPAELRFRPVRAGRKVVLQRYRNGAWRNVASATQNRQGRAHFNIATSAARKFRHRAVTVKYRGAPAVRSQATTAVRKKLLFSDNFNGSALNTDKWGYRQLGLRNPGSRQCAESSRSAVAVNNGKLRLQVRKIARTNARYDLTKEADGTCPHGQFFNGHIGTQGKFDTRYGFMAARIRFPAGQGQHGAFWSQPNSGPGAEIDIVEYFGNGFPNRRTQGVPAGASALQHTIYWRQADGSLGKAGGLFDLRRLLGKDKTWSNSYHIYSVEWTPSVYIFRVDGHETFRTKRGRSSQHQYLIMSLLTSDWEIPNLNQSTLPTTMLVDWVRVWQR
ncbi:MAG TPA: glycoside hydrolase family 16 protein [Egibacteraceae bacterium]|nr:glycoside hydrolase family 16 protein [Egibacteraceae bacterium]